MTDSILDLVKQTISKSIPSSAKVPATKKSQTIDVMTDAVTDGLKNNLSLDNILNINDLFKKGSSVEKNPITTDIAGSVAGSLIKKIGLSEKTASLISTTVVPLVMKAISGKVNDPKAKGFDITSLIKMFGGEKGGGLLGSLGSLFS